MSQAISKPLVWQDIRDSAARFAHDNRDASREQGRAQIFWHDFFAIFGVKSTQIAIYEQHVKTKLGDKAKTKDGRIDVFWPGRLLVEHKSLGKNLDAAFDQALGYTLGLKPLELPQTIVVSDFARIRIIELLEGTTHEFNLADLPLNIERFAFIAGYPTGNARPDVELDLDAVAQMGELHDALAADGYTGHRLEVFLVRLLFCLFADDTGIFNPADAFRTLIELRSADDGSDLGSLLAKIFQALNQRQEDRQKSLDELVAQLPHVNGKLFEDKLDIPEFTREMRALILRLCDIRWRDISPAIFGAMFQTVIESEGKASKKKVDRRRQLGAHYTSEENILKLIKPLFLDELQSEFERVKGSKNALFEFHKRLRLMRFLDPARGCGNFLVITYRELRRVEHAVLLAAEKFGTRIGDVFKAVEVNVDQFYGIEIEDFPAQIAQVAMWLMDHQMNLEVGKAFGGSFFKRIPLATSATVRRADALTINWDDFFAPQPHSFILGNPPFIGKQLQTPEQKKSLELVTGNIKGAGVLDFVAGWYLKAAQYLSGTQEGFASPSKSNFQDVRFGLASDEHAPSTRAKRGKNSKVDTSGIEDIFVSFEQADRAARHGTRCGFVSTNSVAQGEQVGVLWGEMLRRGVHIQFAHRTFQWMNDAPGKAAVHCVIIGFGIEQRAENPLSDYADIKGQPATLRVQNINPYLVAAGNVLLPNRREAICDVPPIVFGSMPNDGGHLLLSNEEKRELLAAEPEAKPWIRPFLGAEEFINDVPRWCLWLVGIAPSELIALPEVSDRVERVRGKRAESDRGSTRRLANTPTLFGEIRQPEDRYVLVPRHSSENRRFVPMGFVTADKICGDSNLCVPGATAFHWAVLMSTMHMAWVRYVCGRLKSDFRYSNGIVYNNFPWPGCTPPYASRLRQLDDKAKKLVADVEAAAQAVLDARLAFVGQSLADLYGDAMPPPLTKAHQALDRTVDAAYVPDGGKRTWSNDGERVAFLFERYKLVTSGTDLR